MLRKILFILIALHYCFTIQAPKPSLTLELQNISWRNVSAPVKNSACTMKKLATSRYSINLWLELSRLLNKNAEVGVLLYYRMMKGLKNVKFLDVKMNICEFLNHVTTMPLLRAPYIELARSSNLPYSCPIQGNLEYNVTNYVLTNSVFPPYTPSIYFNYSLNFYENQKLIGVYVTEGYTIRK